MSSPRPFVRVLGVALALHGCHKESATSPVPPPSANPPPPPIDPPAPPTTNPPAPDGAEPAPTAGGLPRWDDVASGHPEGATNPPYPILVVTADTHACYKVWRGGMIPPPEDVRLAHGRVVATAADIAERGTAVQCPTGEPDALLAAYAALPATVGRGPL